MSQSASQFVGEIPQNYDTCLGPIFFEDYAADLARRVAALAPARVLELAAGTGILSRRLRDALPQTTELLVTDLNPPMLEVARTKFAAGETVAFQPADAMDLPFGADEFDAVACQFGAMFFPDKVAAFRETARVLRPGGRYLFNTWGSMAENPVSEIAYALVTEIFASDPPGFLKVPFSYCDPGAVCGDLEAAGFRETAFEALTFEKEVPDWTRFARGLIFGNPMVDEIRARGQTDPETVVVELAARMEARWGASPSAVPLKASIFSAIAP